MTLWVLCEVEVALCILIEFEKVGLAKQWRKKIESWKCVSIPKTEWYSNAIYKNYVWTALCFWYTNTFPTFNFFLYCLAKPTFSNSISMHINYLFLRVSSTTGLWIFSYSPHIVQKGLSRYIHFFDPFTNFSVNKLVCFKNFPLPKNFCL